MKETALKDPINSKQNERTDMYGHRISLLEFKEENINKESSDSVSSPANRDLIEEEDDLSESLSLDSSIAPSESISNNPGSTYESSDTEDWGGFTKHPEL